MKNIKNLPSPIGLSKEEILNTLLTEEYGHPPKRPTTVTATVLESDETFCGGKTALTKIMLKCNAEWGEYSFPIYYTCPRGKTNVPAFVHINFRDLIPDKHQPTEEIIDNGFAVLTVCYKDITSDDGDFTNGMAGILYPDGKRGPHDCGKIAMWAWAASVVMDYALTLPELDKTRISVIGHSRLGKTALLAGALDERFYCAISNDSGCSGASISRENEGETIEVITRVFPFWFCEHYREYADNEDALPFDQHWLVAANVPHKVYVASAQADEWACPENEYLSCIHAGEYYKFAGMKGFDPIETGRFSHTGDVAYHVRPGGHFLSREDWGYFIKYLSL